MWMINKDGAKTFINPENIKKFENKGWKLFVENAKENQTETKKRNKK